VVCCCPSSVAYGSLAEAPSNSRKTKSVYFELSGDVAEKFCEWQSCSFNSRANAPRFNCRFLLPRHVTKIVSCDGFARVIPLRSGAFYDSQLQTRTRPWDAADSSSSALRDHARFAELWSALRLACSFALTIIKRHGPLFLAVVCNFCCPPVFVVPIFHIFSLTCCEGGSDLSTTRRYNSRVQS